MKHVYQRASALLVALALCAAALTEPARAQEGGAQDTTLTAADGTAVTIDRDTYGIPHIRGASEAGVFYGQGFATAQDRLFQMETYRRAALGRLSEIDLGTVAQDRFVRTLFYTEAERQAQFDALRPEAQTMISAFVEGVNAYIVLTQQDPLTYKPLQFFQLPDPEPWTETDVVAVMQFFMRRFGQFGGEELLRAAELAALGPEAFNELRPINDPGAPTTIQNGGGGSPSALRRAEAPAAAPLRQLVRPEAAQKVVQKMRRAENSREEIDPPYGLGSFAVLTSAAKSANGSAMLLGAPQLGEDPSVNSTSRAVELELECPTLHVGGMTIAGIPGVIIGRTEAHAWSLTSGRSDNTDTYVEVTESASFDRYLFNGEFLEFEAIEEPDLDFTHYRTVHGPVIGADLANNQAFSYKFTFWQEELKMLEAFYDVWKAEDADAFAAVMPRVPMSFNVFYAGEDLDVRFWHVGFYPDRAEGVDPRLPQLGTGAEEWDGLIPFENQPQATGEDQDYFVNWNNKPATYWDNGDNVPWALVPDRLRGTIRVEEIDAYVGPISNFTYADLKNVPPQAIDTTGSYMQAIEFLATGQEREASRIQPGQSGFISANGVPSPHFADQWLLYLSNTFKNMRFDAAPEAEPGQDPTPPVCGEIVIERDGSGVGTAVLSSATDEESGIAEITYRRLKNLDGFYGAGEGRTGRYARGESVSFDPGEVETVVLGGALADPSKRRVAVVVEVVNGAGLTSRCDPVVSQVSAEVPTAFALRGHWPNPVTAAGATVGFEVAEASEVSLEVYDVLGRRVAVLVDGEMAPGSYEVAWKPAALPSGVYLYRMRAGSFSASGQMALVK